MSEKRKIITFVFIICICNILFSYAEVVDKILVIVNDEIITQGEVDRILYPIYMQYRDLYSGQELLQKIDLTRQNILKRLIQDKILLGEARKREIEIDERELEAKIDEIKKHFPSEEGFKKALKEENMTLSTLTKRHRERMQIDKLVDTEIRRRVSISPNELMRYYKSHKDEFRQPQKVKLKSILIKVGEKRSEGSALRMAKNILKRLTEGGDFALLAEKYSDGPYAASGGDMGWVKEGELMDKINKLVFSLEEKGLSGILKTDLGFHIFRVEEKMDATIKEFPEAKDEVREILFNMKVEEKLGQWIQELKKNAYIAFR